MMDGGAGDSPCGGFRRFHSDWRYRRAAKFASSLFYRSFHQAIGGKQAAGGGYLDKRAYQIHPANLRGLAGCVARMKAEGRIAADVVRPGGALSRCEIREPAKSNFGSASCLSGVWKYSRIHAAARLGWLDLERVRDESPAAIKRASRSHRAACCQGRCPVCLPGRTGGGATSTVRNIIARIEQSQTLSETVASHNNFGTLGIACA